MKDALPVAGKIRDIDGLRLAALGRIERCSRCPRYEALVAAHLAERRAPRPSAAVLPAVPQECHFQACSPLVARWTWAGRAAQCPPAAPASRAVC